MYVSCVFLIDTGRYITYSVVVSLDLWRRVYVHDGVDREVRTKTSSRQGKIRPQHPHAIPSESCP